MNERLKALRKNLNLSQEAFGKKLGVTGAGISKIESGDRSLTEQMLISICREFNVNEEWFRTGEGEMFIKMDRGTELAKWAGSILHPDNDDSFQQKFVHMLSKLNENDWKALEKMAVLMAEDNEKS